jgi:hypothetical protein
MNHALPNFTSIYFQAQGRYLFPAIGLWSISLAGGWLEWGRRRKILVSWGIVGAVFILALYALFGVVFPGFQRTV